MAYYTEQHGMRRPVAKTYDITVEKYAIRFVVPVLREILRQHRMEVSCAMPRWAGMLWSGS